MVYLTAAFFFSALQSEFLKMRRLKAFASFGICRCLLVLGYCMGLIQRTPHCALLPRTLQDWGTYSPAAASVSCQGCQLSASPRSVLSWRRITPFLGAAYIQCLITVTVEKPRPLASIGITLKCHLRSRTPSTICSFWSNCITMYLLPLMSCFPQPHRHSWDHTRVYP